MAALKRFNRILLATDGSEQARAAVEATIAIAAPSATVKVVHVWRLEIHHRHATWDVDVRKEADHLIDATVENLLAAGIIAEREICRSDSSHVAAAVSVSAKAFGADLVVIGARALSQWQSVEERNVCDQSLCALDCPVLIVRARGGAATGAARRVIWAIASADDLAHGAPAAAISAAARGSAVMVVHMAPALVGVPGFNSVESDEEVTSTLAEAVRLLDDAGVQAQGMVARAGPVARVMGEIAAEWSADLIISGSSRQRDLASILLGAVSYDLLHAADQPVPGPGRIAA
jgi:nucleotide-binding universal stress UspA family protein